MPVPTVRCEPLDQTKGDASVTAAEMAAGLAAIREEHDVPIGFPEEVETEAAAVVAAPIPSLDAQERDDRRDLPMVTLDPASSMDLDQAFAIERRSGGGFTIWYAIADVAAFVAHGGAIDREARQRGVTLYLPDGRTPLHPISLSEAGASLLPDQDRPALLWRLEIDAAGTLTSGRVRRSVVRSRAKLGYEAAQVVIDAGGLDPDDPLQLLQEAGQVLVQAEADRGGVSLPLPEQLVEVDEDGYHLAWRTPLTVENWNAQMSLLCGRAAGNLMIQGGVGLLRTLPPPEPWFLEDIQRRAKALGVTAPALLTEDPRFYPAFVRSLDPDSPVGAALLNAAARGLRGAGYLAFGPGVGETPSGIEGRHSAVAANYAHVTAPLRRLGDRFASEAALALSNQIDVPAWLLESLPEMPALLQSAGQREGAISRSTVDLAEAVVLASRIGDQLDAEVVSDDGDRGRGIQIIDPPIRARIHEKVPLGSTLKVTVTGADPVARKVTMTAAKDGS